MSISTAAVGLTLTVQEQIAATATASANNSLIRHDAMNVSKTLSGSSSPAVTKFAGNELALTAGAATLNLAAASKSTGGTEDFTGSKIQAILLKNKTGNANNMTITVGASNGYDLLGASMNIVLAPGQAILIDLNNASPTVAAADRTIDIAGTGSQVLQYEILG